MYIENNSSVCVMLATFNGENYIDEQIQSILSQTHRNIKIYYSDDCSTDNTIKLLSKYSDISSVTTGIKYGLGALNFYSLIKNVPEDYDFYSFSDQDDIWLPNKLSNAINQLILNCNDLYASNLISCDFDKKVSIIKRNNNITTHDYLYQSLSAGCTYIFTQKLFLEVKKSINKYEIKNLKISHDWLVYAIARKQGLQCMVNKIPDIIYRQHNNNETGANAINIKTLKRVFKRLINKKYKEERLLLHTILGYNEKNTKINSIFILRRNKISSIIIFILIKIGF